MKSFGGGTQLLGSSGFKTRYDFEAPRAGEYALTAQVVAVHGDVELSFAASDARAVEVLVPYTVDMWHQTAPVGVTLNKGRNVVEFEIRGGGGLASRISR